MNTNVQQAGLKLSSRAAKVQADSLQDRLIASIAAWFSLCDGDRVYF